jgi:formylglycine-generating enzyme
LTDADPEGVSVILVGTLSDLVELTGGIFRMGSQEFYPDEGPVHNEHVRPFAIEQHPVTNAQFSEFVSDTEYVTMAERPLDEALFPDLSPEELEPGALAFAATPGPVDLSNWRQWWRWSVGADWQHPFGPESSIEEESDHPVVQVAYADAEAYANWAGRRLPSEAEWEYAARAGSTSTYAWGEEVRPAGQLMANTWQGRFPYENTGAHGWVGTSPVGVVSAQQVRAGRHDRQCLGVDDHHLSGEAYRDIAVLWSCGRARPTGRRSGEPQGAGEPQDAERRITSVRA